MRDGGRAEEEVCMRIAILLLLAGCVSNVSDEPSEAKLFESHCEWYADQVASLLAEISNLNCEVSRTTTLGQSGYPTF